MILARVVERTTDNGVTLLILEKVGAEVEAGQCFSLGVPGKGVNREYSLASSGKNDFRFLIKVVDGGVVSNHLSQVDAGDEIEVLGPYGVFGQKFISDRKGKHLFVATGTGVAPFLSFAERYPDLNFVLLHGISSFDQRVKSDLSGQYVPCVSQEELNGVFFGRVTEYLSSMDLNSFSSVHLCGNRKMISDAYSVLVQRSFDPAKIFSEVFF